MLKLEGKFFLGIWRACEPKAGLSGNDNNLLHKF